MYDAILGLSFPFGDTLLTNLPNYLYEKEIIS
jgi:hypothetical protein